MFIPAFKEGFEPPDINNTNLEVILRIESNLKLNVLRETSEDIDG
jgi:hypothetical protein